MYVDRPIYEKSDGNVQPKQVQPARKMTEQEKSEMKKKDPYLSNLRAAARNEDE